MYEGYVEFEADGDPIELEPLILVPFGTTGVEVELKAHGGAPLSLFTRLSSVADRASAIEIASRLASDFVERLSFTLQIGVGTPWLRKIDLQVIAGTPAASTTSASLGLSMNATTRRRLSISEHQTLSQIFSAERQSLVGDLRMNLFRSALENRDPVARFLSLYNILLVLHRDDQQRVDRFIAQREPAVPQTQSPHRATVIETIYTRLRNEFAHARRGSSFELTRTEMDQNLHGLIPLVHFACTQP